MDIDADAQSIINDIQVAFHGVLRGDVTLHEAEMMDRYGSPEALRRARKLDTETCWEDVPDEHLQNCVAALSHVDPMSWRYYIAPRMIWTLRRLRGDYSWLMDHTIYACNPYKKPAEMWELAMERYTLLNLEQSRCVCRFLRYTAGMGEFVDDDIAKKALRKYWGQFCEARDA